MRTTILFMLFAVISHLAAFSQKYVIDNLFADSASVNYYTLNKDGFVLEDVYPVKLANGDTINALGVNSDSVYILFKLGNKDLCVSHDKVLYCANNPEGASDYRIKNDARRHGAWGHFLATLIPCYTVAAMLLLIVFLYFLKSIKIVRKIGIIAIPLLLLIVGGIELTVYLFFLKDSFWWCSYDTYGFWGSLIRVFPFTIATTIQVLSIKMYRKILFGSDEDARISVKPIFISVGVAFAVGIGVGFAFIFMGYYGNQADLIHSSAVVAAFLIGVIWSGILNIRQMGLFKGGLLTIFCVVYCLGTIIVVIGTGIALLELLIQVITSYLVLCLIFGGGGALSRNTYYSDANGHRHLTEASARSANRMSGKPDGTVMKHTWKVIRK